MLTWQAAQNPRIELQALQKIIAYPNARLKRQLTLQNRNQDQENSTSPAQRCQ